MFHSLSKCSAKRSTLCDLYDGAVRATIQSNHRALQRLLQNTDLKEQWRWILCAVSPAPDVCVITLLVCCAPQSRPGIFSKVIRTLFVLSGKKVAFTDKGRTEKKALTRLENKTILPLKPMVERHIDTFNKLSFSVDLTKPIFPEKAILSSKIIAISGEKQND